MADLKLTKEELARLLDVEIRSRVRDRMRYRGEGAMGRVDGLVGDKTKLRLKAHEVFDSIISSTAWDSNLLDATRAVKFTVRYVERVLRNAIKVGTIKFESTAQKCEALYEEAHRVHAFEGVTERQVAEAIAEFVDETGEAKKPKLGSGERFAKLKKKLGKKGAKNPGALAAYIGRKKFGKGKFAKLAKKGAKGKKGKKERK